MNITKDKIFTKVGSGLTSDTYLYTSVLKMEPKFWGNSGPLKNWVLGTKFLN